ncbi:cysteine proteinase [Tricholoma matsutake]|nr:cysteine proteinase [Tricholoma matsutake 945]
MENLDEQCPQPSGSHVQQSTPNVGEQLDLVGGTFAVIESDPGVFTSLARKLGIRNLELVEMYDIEPWAVDHLNPRGLIFCFLWRKDSHRPADFDDPAAERVWFANQLSDDACASHALLNVVLNCPDIDIGEPLRAFKQDTEMMSPVMKGLAVTNSSLLRQAHNSLVRPADIRSSLNSTVIATLDQAKARGKPKTKLAQKYTRDTKPSPAKRAKTSKTSSQAKEAKAEKDESEMEDAEEVYHFIGYVPAYGKVWELDGLKSGPLEVGELPIPFPAVTFATASQSLPQLSASNNAGWMDVVRPALRMKMEKYGGAAEGGNNIRFSLLAIVDGLYEKASDELELLKRERIALERRLGVGWEHQVDQTLWASAQNLFGIGEGQTSSVLGRTYAQDFGAQRMEKDMEIMNMPEKDLISAWERCVQNGLRAKMAVDDEVMKGVRANTDHLKRTFDYEPFFKEFVSRLQQEGLLNPLLGLDNDGNAIKAKGTTRRGKEKRNGE